MPATPFSEALNRLLTASGLTQLQLSNRTGFAASSINRYISGQTTPSLDRIEPLAEVVGSLDELRRAWRLTTTGTVLPEWTRNFYAIETAAVAVRVATPSFVPGYLQSPGVASYVFRASRPSLQRPELEEQVTNRTDRLSQLTGLHVTAVFPLAAVADLPEELRQEQAQHLLGWIATGRVRVHLVPAGIVLPAPVAPLFLFALGTGESVAVSEHVLGAEVLRDDLWPRAVSLYDVALSESLPVSLSRTELERLTA
jgi:transcriptional regulator with XRE-family HTH domain